MKKPPAQPNAFDWCGRCGTRHLVGATCPRVTEASGPEVVGWRVGAHTARGLEGIGVIVAPCGRHWRARVVSFPNVLWMAPGSRESMKFLGGTQDQALRSAMSFVRRHCAERGYLMRDELECAPQAASEEESVSEFSEGLPEKRIERRLPVLFGIKRPTVRATTRNMSTTGLFVSTDSPRGEGSRLGLSLELEYSRVPLRGEVTWYRPKTSPGTISGMGIRLFQPPGVYTNYVERLMRVTKE